MYEHTLRKKVINSYERGERIKDLSNNYGMSQSTIRLWVKMDKMNLNKDEKEILLKRIENLEKQNLELKNKIVTLVKIDN